MIRAYYELIQRMIMSYQSKYWNATFKNIYVKFLLLFVVVVLIVGSWNRTYQFSQRTINILKRDYKEQENTKDFYTIGNCQHISNNTLLIGQYNYVSNYTGLWIKSWNKTKKFDGIIIQIKRFNNVKLLFKKGQLHSCRCLWSYPHRSACMMTRYGHDARAYLLAHRVCATV